MFFTRFVSLFVQFLIRNYKVQVLLLDSYPFIYPWFSDLYLECALPCQPYLPKSIPMYPIQVPMQIWQTIVPRSTSCHHLNDWEYLLPKQIVLPEQIMSLTGFHQHALLQLFDQWECWNDLASLASKCWQKVSSFEYVLLLLIFMQLLHGLYLGVSYAYTILHVLSLILRMNNWHDSESQRPVSGNILVELFVLLTRPSSEIMQDYCQKISYTTHLKEKWINHTHIIKTLDENCNVLSSSPTTTPK